MQAMPAASSSSVKPVALVMSWNWAVAARAAAKASCRAEPS